MTADNDKSPLEVELDKYDKENSESESPSNESNRPQADAKADQETVTIEHSDLERKAKKKKMIARSLIVFSIVMLYMMYDKFSAHVDLSSIKNQISTITSDLNVEVPEEVISQTQEVESAEDIIAEPLDSIDDFSFNPTVESIDEVPDINAVIPQQPSQEIKDDPTMDMVIEEATPVIIDFEDIYEPNSDTAVNQSTTTNHRGAYPTLDDFKSVITDNLQPLTEQIHDLSTQVQSLKIDMNRVNTKSPDLISAPALCVHTVSPADESCEDCTSFAWIRYKGVERSVGEGEILFDTFQVHIDVNRLELRDTASDTMFSYFETTSGPHCYDLSVR